MERFGRPLGRAWWHVTKHTPERLLWAIEPLDLALEAIPGFVQGTIAAYQANADRERNA
jgi:hypothetical protein